METLQLPPYCPETVSLEKYAHVTPFLHAMPTPRDLRTHEFVSRKEVCYLRKMMWKAANVTQIS